MITIKKTKSIDEAKEVTSLQNTDRILVESGGNLKKIAENKLSSAINAASVTKWNNAAAATNTLRSDINNLSATVAAHGTSISALGSTVTALSSSVTALQQVASTLTTTYVPVNAGDNKIINKNTGITISSPSNTTSINGKKVKISAGDIVELFATDQGRTSLELDGNKIEFVNDGALSDVFNPSGLKIGFLNNNLVNTVSVFGESIGIGSTTSIVKIQGVTTPVLANDAANKKYVDDQIAAIPGATISGDFVPSFVENNGSTVSITNNGLIAKLQYVGADASNEQSEMNIEAGYYGSRVWANTTNSISELTVYPRVINLAAPSVILSGGATIPTESNSIISKDYADSHYLSSFSNAVYDTTTGEATLTVQMQNEDGDFKITSMLEEDGSTSNTAQILMAPNDIILYTEYESSSTTTIDAFGIRISKEDGIELNASTNSLTDPNCGIQIDPSGIININAAEGKWVNIGPIKTPLVSTAPANKQYVDDKIKYDIVVRLDTNDNSLSLVLGSYNDLLLKLQNSTWEVKGKLCSYDSIARITGAEFNYYQLYYAKVETDVINLYFYNPNGTIKVALDSNNQLTPIYS